MRRLRPSLLVFAVALLGSLSVHLPVYEVLGVLADVLRNAPKPAKPTFVELELAPLAPEPHAERVEPKPDVPKPAAPEPPPDPPKPEAKAEPEPQRAPEPEPEVVQAEPVPATPLPEIQSQQAVEQKSDDPTVAPPDDARFIAEENRRVLEETNATVRSFQKDDPEPTPTSRPSEAVSEDEPGDATEAEVADLHDVEGSRERKASQAEARQVPEQPSEASAGQREAAALARSEPPPTPMPTREAAPAQASGAPSGGEEETMIVQDAFGSFVIHKRPEGRGEGDDGGALAPGLPAPNRQNRARSEARSGRKPNLQLSWSQFEQAFGEERLKAQREQYIEQRRSVAQGSGRQARWKKFRGAIENFLPSVQPGTQTALNAAASPFASYLAAVHRNIHREFAHGFLAGLPIAGGPFSDRTLNTTLEIVLNGDGSVHEVGVVKTSGFMPFDYGAFDAVMRAAPYPPAPRSILSGDGRVYVHWGFHRNERQCGTFNARPFILPNPDGTPAPGETPLRDDGEGEGDAPNGPVYDGDEGELGAAPRRRVLRHDG